MREILEQNRTARLACSFNDQPYIVPITFVFDGNDCLYALSAVGRKIKWMRENPLVCLELDKIENQYDWTSLVIFGRYQELPDSPEFRAERDLAHKLLSKYPMWWQPALDAEHLREEITEKPIYFRIHIEDITGQRDKSREWDAYLDTPISENTQKNRLWDYGR
ncbi:MAG: pyridoxamine 5'-phosphate oxidase family protein [Pyrinomonadaceae bacterium]|nr:pyridoxamine 5'-phosphate oxidase family protein [Pyrinomonadaceae bacterium]